MKASVVIAGVTRAPTIGFFLLIIGITIAHSQTNTVGTILNKGENTGYILFAPMNHKITYLIDREGQLINSWTSEFVPGLTAFLAEDGSLFRAGRVTDATYINAAGAGGVIERFDWEGNLTWQYKYADRQVRQHHDFELMPNGNVLLIAWEEISKEYAVENGRDPSTINSDRLWPDHLVEVAPQGFSEGKIVWEWHVLDHLIQDFDPSKSNFGVVSEHPERIDFNYIDLPISDWVHSNSIEYNASLDQVLISSRSFNEVWIIDHSTTIEESRSSEGGRAGRGGDLLFRWGNPQACQQGDSTDQRLFGQHGIDWYADDQVLIFNNGLGRLKGTYASVEQINLIQVDGTYPLSDDLSFIIDSTSQTFFSDRDTLFAPLFSNVQGLEVGHLLLCLGPRGTFIEYNAAGDQIWKYVSPVHENGTILNQGDDIGDRLSSNNSVFHVTHYPVGFRGFAHKDMSPGQPIEGPGTTTSTAEYTRDQLIIYPNPASDVITVDAQSSSINQVEIFDQSGRLIKSFFQETRLSIRDLDVGTYFIAIDGKKPQKLVVCR